MKLYSISLIALLVTVAGCRSARMETAGTPPGSRAQPESTSFAGDGGRPPVVPRDDQDADVPPPASAPNAPAQPAPPTGSGAGPLEPNPSGQVILPARGRDRTRITSINGKYDPNHPTEIYVRPGEVVNLTADVFDLERRGLGLPPEAFAWSSSLERGDECLGGPDCLQHSNFQRTPYGVAFYTPPQMGQSVRIVVESRDPRGRGTRDTLVVINADWDGRPRPAPVLVTDPRQYPGASLDPNVALNGFGRWVVIDNVRYFTPYTFELGGQPWAPYRNGYWTRENAGAVTWISYDPWGWMTDHYGVWRHHRSYGWLWLPFPDRRYQPHCVSWFNQGNYVGWYPYHKGFPDAYRHRTAHGFDDGFWLDFRVGLGFGSAGYAYNPGIAIVPMNQIANVNVMSVLVTGQASFGVVQGAFNRPIHAVPTFLPPQVLPMTTVGFVTTAGGARIMQPRALHPVPTDTGVFLQRLGSVKRPLPIGTAWQNANLVPPRQGFAPAPVVFDRGRVLGVAPVNGVDGRHMGLPVLRKDQMPRLTSGGAVPPAAVAQAAPVRGTAPRKR